MTFTPTTHDRAERRHLPHGEVQVHLLDLDYSSTIHPATNNSSYVHSLDDLSAHNSLDATERERAARFLQPDAHRRYVQARTGLRRLLGDYLGLEPARVPISLSREGKPFVSLQDTSQQIGFNVSHSGRYALLAFVRGHQIGVDLEAVNDRPGLEEVAARFFAPPELAALRRLPASGSLHAFYRTWTRREAALKALGLGLTASPTEVQVAVNACTEAWLLSVQPPHPAAPSWLTRDLEIDPGYSTSLAVPGGAGYRVRLVESARLGY